ncbi:MAG: hypothetical protein PHX82_03890 [Paracoccaceae bacterium]|jgi:hypothetical protein|nr:hypothetical protein [Paracoccaceae bacterium]
MTVSRVCFIPVALIAALGLAAPASADASLGVGLTFVFGGGAGIGARVFSNDEEDKAALSVGLDYMFQSRQVRPTIGAAYLGDNTYVGVDMGFNMGGGGVDFGLGLGGVNTQKKVSAPPLMQQ